jgi:hypothetical protein
MDNNKQIELYSMGVWKITKKWSCIPLVVWKITNNGAVFHEVWYITNK